LNCRVVVLDIIKNETFVVSDTDTHSQAGADGLASELG
jgi:hypothetical protein